MKRKYLLSICLFFIIAFIFSSFETPYNRHPNNYCVSGDSFRSYCDFAYDELDRSLDPSSVKPGNVIFVKTDFLGEFFQKIHPKINSKYIIVSHNSDYGAPGNFKAYLDDEKLVAWFAQNVDGYVHKKLHPIPIGIANKMWPHGNEELIKKYMKGNFKREYFLYNNFKECTYFERIYVNELFKDLPYCHSSGLKDYENYLKDVASSFFILTPRGNGVDTHRIWEAFYLGSVAIVKTSSLDTLYADLPVIIVKDWKEVNEEFLKAKFLEMENKHFLYEKLDIKYWHKLIDSYKSLCVEK